jgi:hypothetical protein
MEFGSILFCSFVWRTLSRASGLGEREREGEGEKAMIWMINEDILHKFLTHTVDTEFEKVYKVFSFRF